MPIFSPVYVLSMGVITAYNDAVMAIGPQNYYKFSETSGATVVDSSGNGENSVYVAGETLQQPSLLPSGEGDSVRLSGSSSRITTPGNITGPSSLIGHSFGCWYQADSSSSVYALVGYNNQAPYFGFRLNEGGNNEIRAFVNTSGGLANLTYTHSDNTSPTFIMATSVQNGTLWLYVDGSPVASASVPNSPYNGAAGGTNNNIGAYRDNTGDFFAGLVDEFTIFNLELTAGEVLGLYNAAL